jgi:hypothetical protein
MTVINQFKLVNNDNSKGIKFHYAKGVKDNITISNVTVQQTGKTASDNYARNWGGFKRIISVDFVLKNDGSDKSTAGDSIVTLNQQWDYLMDQVIQGNLNGAQNVTYTATIYIEGATKTYTGAIEDITIGENQGDSNSLAGSFNLYVSK